MNEANRDVFDKVGKNMNWIAKLFGDDTAVSSAEIAAKIVRVEAELASLSEKFDQAHATMLRASQSGKGDRPERIKVDGLRADIEHAREQLEALRRAHSEAVEAEQKRELDERWEAAQGAGVRLLAAAQRVQLAIDSVGAQYVELITLLDEFTGALPIHAHDLHPCQSTQSSPCALAAIPTATSARRHPRTRLNYSRGRAISSIKLGIILRLPCVRGLNNHDLKHQPTRP